MMFLSIKKLYQKSFILVGLISFVIFSSNNTLSAPVDCVSIDCIAINDEYTSAIFHRGDKDLYVNIEEEGVLNRDNSSFGFFLSDGSDLKEKSVVVDNKGLIAVKNIAFLLSGVRHNLQINNSGIIKAKYITSHSDYDSIYPPQLSIVNNGGEMNGIIVFGQYTDSSLTLNDGVINGDLRVGSNKDDISHLIELKGGVLNGNIAMYNSGLVVNLGETDFNGAITNYDGIDSGSEYGGVVNVVASRNLDDGMSLGSDIFTLDEINITNNSDVFYNGSYVNSAKINIHGGSSLTLSSVLNANSKVNVLRGSKLSLGNQNHEVRQLFVESGSEIGISILEDLGDAIYPTITTSGAAIIQNGAAMNITTSGDNYSYIKSGSSFLIIDGADGSDMKEIKDVNDNHGILSFSTRVVNKSKGGQLYYVDAIRPPVTSITKDKNSQNVLQAIQSVGNNSVGELRSMLNYLDYSSSGSTIESVLQTLTPNDYNYAQINSLAMINEKISITEDRMDKMHMAYLRRKRRNSEDDYLLTENIELADNSDDINSYLLPFLTKKKRNESKIANWVQIFGTKAKQKNVKDNGYNSDSYGVAFGFDKKIENNVRAGISFGHNLSDITSSSDSRSTNVESYLANLYVSKSMGKYFTDAVLGVAWNDYNTSRAINTAGLVADGEYSGQNYISKIRGGVVLDRVANSNWNVMPEISTTFISSKVDSYTEQNAGSLSLQVRSNSSEYFEGRLGVNVSYNSIKAKLFTKNKSFMLVPKLHVSYGHNFLNKKQTTVANFIGESVTFSNMSSQIGSGSLRTGIDLDIYDLDSVTVSANYTDERRSNYSAKSASIRFRYEF